MSFVQRRLGSNAATSAARSLALSGAMLVTCVGGVAYWSAAATAPSAKGADKPAAASKANKKDAAPADPDKPIDFATDIQPIFSESCVRCHKARGGGPGGARGPGAPGGGGGGDNAQRGPGGGGRGPGGMGPGGGLRLDDKAAALKGGRHGKSIITGKADDSLLYNVLNGRVKVGNDEVHQMPKARPNQEAKPLPDDQIDLIKRWIDQGAKWPDAAGGEKKK